MKTRRDFVTNSSSASYIICFARISDKKKAKEIIDKHDIEILNADDVRHQMTCGELGADWAGACIWGVDKILNDNPDGEFVVIEGYNDADYDDDGEPEYNYDFDEDKIITDITEANGFTNIEVAEGEGRNG